MTWIYMNNAGVPWLALGGLLATSSAAGEAAFQAVVEPFPLADVRLTEGIFKDAQEANRRYLHDLEADRLLHAFRVNAGLPSEAEPLGGWERPDCEVRGHFVGHYLSACALMFAATGDEELKAKGDYLVAELAKVQEALGGGYLSAYPESFLDRLEARQNVTWAPLYVIHKIMAGLLDMSQLAGNEQALQMLRKMADYFKARADNLSDVQFDRLLDVEFGGMSEVLHNLSAVTGEEKYLALAHRFDKAAFLGPLALEHDNLTGLHANTHLPEICGAARHYELTGDERYRTAVRFFWDRRAETRTYATGGSNVGEVWPEPNRLAPTLSTNNQECCTTHNFLKITRYLFRWTAAPKYADFYERALFNGILGTQGPNVGELMYYVPLLTGSTKTFGTPYDSFWCCYGTGIESFAKLGDSIYFHDENGLYVNLFIASTVRWREKGFTLEQTTRFPEEPGTTLTVRTAQPVRFALRLRVPWWATAGVEVKLNGEPWPAEAKPSSYLTLEREWTDGDTVQVAMPLTLSTAPLPDDPERMALMVGPLVLAGLTERDVYFLSDLPDLSSWLRPVPGEPLTFETVGQPTNLRFIPLYRVVKEPYGIYFVVTPKGSPRHQQILAQEEAKRRREARMVDQVVIGDAASETAHHLQGENTQSGPFGGRHWRHCGDGGYFSYDLKVEPEGPMTLAVTYWGSDVPPRKFDVLVDGQVVATQELNRNRPNEFFEVEYPLPLERTQGRDKITVRFQPHPGNLAGGVFGLAILRPEAGMERP